MQCKREKRRKRYCLSFCVNITTLNGNVINNRSNKYVDGLSGITRWKEKAREVGIDRLLKSCPYFKEYKRSKIKKMTPY